MVVLFAVGISLCASAAATLRSYVPWSPAAAKHRLDKPLSAYKMGEFPLQRISREQFAQYRGEVARAKGGLSASAAPVPPATTPQFLDLTTNPRPPQVGSSTLCQEKQPCWSWDQQYIYIASNNVDPTGSYGTVAPTAQSLFHIYRMTSDGAFILQITGLTQAEQNAQQEFPAINHAATKMAYVVKTNANSPGQLWILDFFTGQRQQVTGIPVTNNPLNLNLTGVEHPSWAPGDDAITIAARDQRVSNDVRNVYTINVTTKVAARITNGTPTNGVECIDPMYHPDSAPVRIAFASNSNGINPATGDLLYAKTALRDLRGIGRAADIDHNLFLAPAVSESANNPATQLTTDPADDIEPSYNRTVNSVNQPVAGSFYGWLAFSSLGRQAGAGSAAGNTYDIYFNDGSDEVTNAPIRLFTPDTNAGAVPLSRTDERYPTWSAGLPPQNPIDRIAFSSNRKNNVDDVANPLPLGNNPAPAISDTDIWAAEVTDITPPTLFQFDEQKGEVLHIANAPLPDDPNAPDPGRRVGTPGDTFYCYAKLKDLQYGVNQVFLQIKDPDGPSTDAQGVNHKLYGVGTFPTNDQTPKTNAGETFNSYPVRWTGSNPLTITHWLHLPWETDCEGIGVNDYQYYSGPVVFDPASSEGNHIGANARYASYNPGVDDSVRWSGNDAANRPPVDTNGNYRWLELKDDGRGADKVANDGTFSATWVSPIDPSDYYVDLIAYDKAFNPRSPNEKFNWIIYDNIWGFSTQSFVSHNDVLFVDDNGAGQKWPRGLKGSFRPFPVFRYGTESDCTDRPTQFDPREVEFVARSSNDTQIPGGTIALYNINDPYASAGVANEVFNFLNGDAVPYTRITWGTRSLRAMRYDMWRVLAKGAVPESVFNDYVPTTDEQPRDIEGKTTQQQPVPRRAVVWSSPYTGDIFLGAGSILDQATQQTLATYKSRAGRLMVAGGDIVWALVANPGPVSNPFLRNVLGVQSFVSDETYGNWNAFQSNALSLAITQDVVDNRFAVVSGPYWGGYNDPDPLGTSTSWPSWSTNPISPPLVGNSDFTASTDGTPFRTQDSVTPDTAAGWQPVFANRMHVQDDTVTAANPNGTNSKTVFLSASLGSLGRRYVAENDTPAHLDCMNYKAKISHAMFCWMFSADLVGQVRSLNGGAPVSGAFVWVPNPTAPNNPALALGAAFTHADGTYVIRGLQVAANWTVRVDNPGFFSFNKATGSGSHALEQQQLDVLLTPAAPGSISGKVLDQSQQPVPGARVKATIKASPLYTGQLDFFATTDLSGTYSMPSVPTASYTVDIDALPSAFGGPILKKFTNPVVVNPAQPGQDSSTPTPTTAIDFEVQGQPGPLDVHVYEDINGTKGNPINGVDVALVDSTNTPIPGYSTQTKNVGGVDGIAHFDNVKAGPITVSAFLFGYQPGSATVNIPQQNTVDVLLPRAPVQELYGEVQRQIDGTDLDGTKENLQQLELRLQVSQQVVLKSDITAPSAVPVQHNYHFTAQAGQFSIAYPGDTRYLPNSVNVTINQAQTVAPVLQLQGRPGVLSGIVQENLGGTLKPVSGASILVRSTRLLPGTTVATLQSAADGTWQTTGTIASDVYDLVVTKLGYIDKTISGVFLAGNTNVSTLLPGEILLVRTGRGRVYGLVSRNFDSQPVEGVQVQFWTPANSPYGQIQIATKTTGPAAAEADGRNANYTVGDPAPTADFLPEGTYEVRVPASPQFAAFVGTVTVVASTSRRFDITLTALPGVLDGLVLEQNPDGSPGVPIAGATVKVVRGASTVIATLTTDALGHYQTPSTIAPGSYTLQASAFNHLAVNASVVVIGPTTAADILLPLSPDSTIRGAVTSNLNNVSAPIENVRLDLLTLAGAPVGTVQPAFSTNTLTGTPPSNYAITGVRTGDYIVRASKTGWVTAQRTLHITPGVDANGIDFVLQAEHTFGQGLQLISLPYNLPGGTDLAAVLNQPRSSFKSAYYLPSSGTYAIYPAAEAAEIRLGKGMFVRFPQQAPFTSGGTVASNAPFNLPVTAGWNLIGAVRKQRIAWLRVKVVTGDGTVRTMQQAMDAGIILNGLFSYADGYYRSDYLDPYSGYFMKAYQDCTLVIPVDNSASIAIPGGTRAARTASNRTTPSVEQVGRELARLKLGPEPTVNRAAAPAPPAHRATGFFSSALKNPLSWLLQPIGFLGQWMGLS